MLHRRDFMAGTLGAGVMALGGCATTGETDHARAILEQTVGSRAAEAGMIAVAVDDGGTRMTSHGSSGAPNLPLDGAAVFEIMSITKVLTALLLADMVARGEVAFDDPVAKHLPPSVTLRERGGPITLLDLATYTSGLPNMPGNLPPNWYANPDPLGDYTEAQLYEFLSSHVPEHEPGAHYEYANLGFGLLGNALAHRAGKTYEELLIERICDPLGLDHMRIMLTPDMRKHLVQGHDLEMRPTQLWNFPAMPGAGTVRTSVDDLTVFLKACMGFERPPLSASLARLRQTRRPTPLPGTEAALGWFISSDETDEIVWKSGLSGGCNTFIGFSTRHRRGVLVFSNFLWRPIDEGTIGLGISLINPAFNVGNTGLIYL